MDPEEGGFSGFSPPFFALRFFFFFFFETVPTVQGGSTNFLYSSWLTYARESHQRMFNFKIVLGENPQNPPCLDYFDWYMIIPILGKLPDTRKLHQMSVWFHNCRGKGLPDPLVVAILTDTWFFLTSIFRNCKMVANYVVMQLFHKKKMFHWVDLILISRCK